MIANRIINAFTDGSAKPNPGFAGYGIYIQEDEKETFIYSGLEGQRSNNYAEATAIIKLLEYLKNSDINTIKILNIYSDSRYVLDGIKYTKNWIKNNWVTSAGTPVQNKELFIRLSELIAEFKDCIHFNWVKGHVGINGNEHADALAERGVKESISGNFQQQFHQLDTIEEHKDKTTKNSEEKLFSITRFLSGARWFFRTGLPKILSLGNVNYFVYLNTTADEPTVHKNDKNLHDHEKFLKRCRNLGKRAPDSHYSIVLTKEPIAGIEELRTLLDEQNKEDHVPIILKLPNLLKRKNWSESIIHKHDLTRIENNIVVSKDGEHLGGFFLPPKNIFKLEETFSLGFRLLNLFNENKSTLVDITDQIFDINKGKVTKQVLKPEFSNAIEFYDVLVPIEGKDKPLTIRLTPTIDIPNRNAFSGLLKVSNEPIKISIMIIKEDNLSYRFVTFIEHEDTIGLYFTPEANLCFY